MKQFATLFFLKRILFLITLSATIGFSDSALSVYDSKIFHFNDDNNGIPINDTTITTWNNHSVFLNNKLIFSKNDERIFNVTKNIDSSITSFFVISNKIDSSHKFIIRTINSKGDINYEWLISRQKDRGFPSFHFTNESLVVLYPESQTIIQYSNSGEKDGQFSLFTEYDRDHEKKLLFKSKNNTPPYILGMKTANLTNAQNVFLFSLNNQLELLTELPLTIPYFSSISELNLFAVVGTKSNEESVNQTPFLILLNQYYHIINKPIKLEKLPQKIIWIEENLYLIYRDHLLIYNTHAQSLPQLIPFNSKMYPFEVFTSGNSLFIVSGKGVGADKNGNFYQFVELMEFDTDTNSMVNRVLHEGRVETVKYFPSENNASFYLRIDNQIVKYTISN